MILKGLALILILGLLIFLALIVMGLVVRIAKPNGIFHIDSYTNKDFYRMIYLTPLEELPKHRILILRVESQKWPTEYLAREEEYE